MRKRTPTKQTPELVAEARFLLNVGYSLRAVGREIGISHDCISSWFRPDYRKSRIEKSQTFRDKNPEYGKAHYAANKANWPHYRSQKPDLHHARQAERRAKTYGTRIESESAEIRELYKQRRLISEQTGIVHHVDHIIPLSKGGTHTIDNLRIITAAENMAKGAKLL